MSQHIVLVTMLGLTQDPDASGNSHMRNRLCTLAWEQTQNRQVELEVEFVVSHILLPLQLRLKLGGPHWLLKLDSSGCALGLRKLIYHSMPCD